VKCTGCVCHADQRTVNFLLKYKEKGFTSSKVAAIEKASAMDVKPELGERSVKQKKKK
jgi:hypothetical protein